MPFSEKYVGRANMGKTSWSSRVKQAVTESKQTSVIEKQHHNVQVMKDTLTRTVGLDSSDPSYTLEQQHAGFMQRWAILVAAGGLKIVGDDGQVIDASKNVLPVATYMTGGARISIGMVGEDGKQLPLDNRIANWLLSGDPSKTPIQENPNLSTAKNGDDARAQGKLGHTRRAATHGFKKGKDGEFREVKLSLREGASRMFQEDTGHYGVDVAIGGRGKDIHENDIKVDGTTGHVYLHQDKTKGSKAQMLIGMESCTDPHGKLGKGGLVKEGQFGKHTPLGGADPITVTKDDPWGPTKSKRFEAEKTAYKGEHPLEGVTIPKRRYDCLRIEMTDKEIDALTSLTPGLYNENVVAMTPCKNVAEFKENYAKLEKGDKSVCFDKDMKDTLGKDELNEKIKVEADAEKAKGSVWGKIKGAFSNLKEKVSNLFKKDADKQSLLQNDEVKDNFEELNVESKSKGPSRSSTIDLSHDKEHEKPVKERRNTSPIGIASRNAGEEFKKQGKDAKEGSRITHEEFDKNVLKLSDSKVSDKKVDKSQIPNEKKNTEQQIDL